MKLATTVTTHRMTAAQRTGRACGDGNVDDGEALRRWNQANDDACNANCMPARWVTASAGQISRVSRGLRAL